MIRNNLPFLNIILCPRYIFLRLSRWEEPDGIPVFLRCSRKHALCSWGEKSSPFVSSLISQTILLHHLHYITFCLKLVPVNSLSFCRIRSFEIRHGKHNIVSFNWYKHIKHSHSTIKRDRIQNKKDINFSEFRWLSSFPKEDSGLVRARSQENQLMFGFWL